MHFSPYADQEDHPVSEPDCRRTEFACSQDTTVLLTVTGRDNLHSVSADVPSTRISAAVLTTTAAKPRPPGAGARKPPFRQISCRSVPGPRAKSAPSVVAVGETEKPVFSAEQRCISNVEEAGNVSTRAVAVDGYTSGWPNFPNLFHVGSYGSHR